MQKEKLPCPRHIGRHPWEDYSANLLTEYTQSSEEGRDIAAYRPLFEAAAALPAGDLRWALGDVLYKAVCDAPTRAGYAYQEPSDLAGIQALRRPYAFGGHRPDAATLRDKLAGAWLGRICGCMLGKTVEGIYTDELLPLLQATGNAPLHRYIRRADLTEELLARFQYPLRDRPYADAIQGMPADDDTNYTVLAQRLIERKGRDFTARDVADAWLAEQPKDAYCTAERVTFCNLVAGFTPPDSAVWHNPYREWIGAQIRGDYFGYINPGDPATAAEMAWRDASISHVKNGIYGEMFIAAMLAVAAVSDDIQDIIRGGLAQIPHTSRLYQAVTDQLQQYAAGRSAQQTLAAIHADWDEHDPHGWCHTIPNALIVTACLLYGGGDYGRSICMAVETGFDTDCNGATVGSILGLRGGSGCIDSAWRDPIAGVLHTSLFGAESLSIDACVEQTLRHLPKGYFDKE